MARRKPSFGPALTVSLLLHAGILAALIFVYPRETANLVLSAVPVEIVSDVQREAAPSPPAPETPPAPQPQPPTPEPPQPKAQPETKPTPTPTARPLPPKAQAKSDDFLKNLTTSLSSPSSAQTQRQPPRPQNHRPGEGRDEVSTGPDIDALKGKMASLWHPNCGSPGAEKVQVGVRLRVLRDGSVMNLRIENPYPNDPVWAAAAQRAAFAARAVRYGELPPEQLRLLTDRGDIYFRLDEKSACS